MDRPRRAGAARVGRLHLPAAVRRNGGSLTLRPGAHAAASALCLLGFSCSSLTGDAAEPVAIEFVVQADSVEEEDTLAIPVRVLNRAGDTVPGAPVSLISLSPDTLAVDPAAAAVIGVRPGRGRIVAVSGDLQSDPLTIRVLAAPDSLGLGGPSDITVPDTDSESSALIVRLLDLTTLPGQASPLAQRTVRWSVVLPGFADLATATATLANDSLGATTVTAAGAGTTQTTVKRRGTGQPDSVVVEAVARRGTGAAVAGSPVRFVVRFP